MQAKKVIVGSFLVAGTCIGGGLLALPIATYKGGFFPSLMIFLLSWFIMTASGLLLLEVCHSMKRETNIISMAEKTLGFGGKVFSWGIYLLLFYSLMVAYTIGISDFLSQVLPYNFSWNAALFFVAFASLFFVGTSIIDRVNVFLMLGLVLFSLWFVWIGTPFVQVKLLQHQNWSLAFLGFPISFISFAFQGVVPTLHEYTKRDLKTSQWAIFGGTLLAFLTYVVWDCLILGIIPVTGSGGLQETFQKGGNALQPLLQFINNANIPLICHCLTFFAIVTSLVGVSLGLFDFLADGLKIPKNVPGKITLLLLVFIPPLGIAKSFPHLFLKALDLSGGVGAALLLGLLPICMVWVERYHHKTCSPKVSFLRKGVLLFIVVALVSEIVLDLFLLFK